MGIITVAAGINGAGKSTFIGALHGDELERYYNPDLRTRELMEAGFGETEANARSWQEGYQALKDAIDQDRHYTFETTLGGTSIVTELFRALALGRTVQILYVGLNSVDLHIQRVADRVNRGGHHIPEHKIRERYITSRQNLMSFIGTQASIRAWDNSAQDPNGVPLPKVVLHIEDNTLLVPDKKALRSPSSWATWVAPLILHAKEKCKAPQK